MGTEGRRENADDGASRLPYSSRIALATVATAWPAAGYGALVISVAADVQRHGAVWVFGWPFVALLATATTLHLLAVGFAAGRGVPPLLRRLAALDRLADASPDARLTDPCLADALYAVTRFPLWNAWIGTALSLLVTLACVALTRAIEGAGAGDVAVIMRGGLYATAFHAAASVTLGELLTRPACRALRRAAAARGIDPYAASTLARGWRVAALIVPTFVALLVAAEIGLSGHGSPLAYAALITLSALLAVALHWLQYENGRSAVRDLGAACRDLAAGREVTLVTGSTEPLLVALTREFRAATRRVDADRERYRAVFEKALDAIVTMDHEGRILEFNRAAEQMFGRRRDDVLGRMLGDVIVPPALREAHRAGVARYVTTGQSSILDRRIELTAVRADGTEFPVELAVSAIHRDGTPLFTAHVRDITDRRRAEDALTASKRRAEEEAEVTAALLHVAETINAHLNETDLFARVGHLALDALGSDWSSIWVRDPHRGSFRLAATAGGREQIVAEVRDLEISPGDFPLVAALRPGALVELVDRDRQTLLPPTLLRHWDTASLLAAPIARGTEIVGVLNVGYRERRGPFSEKQRRIARGIAEATAIALENVRLIDDLQAASRLKSEFVSTMSHELRTPLHVILGSAEMARDAALTATEKAVCLERIDHAGRSLLELIESTLEIGKLEAGREEVAVEPVPLRAWWARLGHELATLPRRRDVALEWDAAVPDVVLHTDPRKLGIVVRNLVGNALKFTERGFVRAEATLGREHIVLRVADTGIGIRAEDHERIFEMFRQADGSDSRRYGGTGLGLYIVRRFVEQLGGTVRVESAPDRGSVFIVSLPCRGASEDVRPAA